MTKAQKSLFKELKKNKSREAFVEMLIEQQNRLGKYSHWLSKYNKKCAKKKVNPVAVEKDVA
ncbi:hypothetical protein TR2A62_0192 [Thalassobium sp. R2A62]|jgi:hypothetical protein|nr:hypothetical protein TR2A62_0192 [Thalassobium sp. R2A62]